MIEIAQFIGGVLTQIWQMLEGKSIPFGDYDVTFLHVFILFPFAIWAVGKLWAGFMSNQSKEN